MPFFCPSSIKAVLGGNGEGRLWTKQLKDVRSVFVKNGNTDTVNAL